MSPIRDPFQETHTSESSQSSGRSKFWPINEDLLRNAGHLELRIPGTCCANCSHYEAAYRFDEPAVHPDTPLTHLGYFCTECSEQLITIATEQFNDSIEKTLKELRYRSGQLNEEHHELWQAILAQEPYKGHASKASLPPALLEEQQRHRETLAATNVLQHEAGKELVELLRDNELVKERQRTLQKARWETSLTHAGVAILNAVRQFEERRACQRQGDEERRLQERGLAFYFGPRLRPVEEDEGEVYEAERPPEWQPSEQRGPLGVVNVTPSGSAEADHAGQGDAVSSSSGEDARALYHRYL